MYFMLHWDCRCSDTVWQKSKTWFYIFAKFAIKSGSSEYYLSMQMPQFMFKNITWIFTLKILRKTELLPIHYTGTIIRRIKHEHIWYRLKYKKSNAIIKIKYEL